MYWKPLSCALSREACAVSVPELDDLASEETFLSSFHLLKEAMKRRLSTGTSKIKSSPKGPA